MLSLQLAVSRAEFEQFLNETPSETIVRQIVEDTAKEYEGTPFRTSSQIMEGEQELN